MEAVEREKAILERRLRVAEAELELYRRKYEAALSALAEENPEKAEGIAGWA
jgi:hypothetical protein